MTERDVYFVYLDNLRESGATNMWGAGNYLVRDFDLDSRAANKILGEWMETFSERHPE